MANDNNRVQLKQEELVGNEVVLTDINPLSNTKSVKDDASGVYLAETLDRMWQSINGKLTRIVNSVNGRTGVVVLNSDDVGLGNVDNVSFADIKKWVIDLLIKEFNNKQIYLAETLDEIDQLTATNDKKYRDRPFYSKYGYGSDKKAYIGYIAYNEAEDYLEHEQMPIFTIGKADNSIIYDEKISSFKDMSGGGIGVNIYEKEDALYLYNSASSDKSKSGLRINKSKIISNVYFYDGIYGDWPMPAGGLNGLILPEEANKARSDGRGYQSVLFYFDDVPMTSGEIKLTYSINKKLIYGDPSCKQPLKVGDTIICNFKMYNTMEGVAVYATPQIPSGMDSILMGLPIAIGTVTKAYDGSAINSSDEYIGFEIKFVSLRPKVKWGLDYKKNHTNITNSDSSSISIKLGKGHANNTIADSNLANYYADYNMSGLNVMASSHRDISDTNQNYYANPNSENPFPALIPNKLGVVPSGTYHIYCDINGPGSTPTVYDELFGGLHISTDMSLCIQPQLAYGNLNAYESCHSKTETYPDSNDKLYIPNTTDNTKLSSTHMNNWATIAPMDEGLKYEHDIDGIATAVTENAFGTALADERSLIGINLLKGRYVNGNLHHNKMWRNLSGLKIIQSGYNYDETSKTSFNKTHGINENDYTPKNPYNPDVTMTAPIFDQQSGGLCVNVGPGLKISNIYPKKAYEITDDTCFYDEGKVCLNLATRGGLSTNSVDGTLSINLSDSIETNSNNLLGVRLSSIANNPLSILAASTGHPGLFLSPTDVVQKGSTQHDMTVGTYNGSSHSTIAKTSFYSPASGTDFVIYFGPGLSVTRNS